MGFRQGTFAKIWKLENKGNYHVAEMSVSKKNDGGGYDVTWQNKFVRLVGTAHTQADKLDTGKSVKIGACDVTNKYDKEKNTTYTNYVIFAFEDDNNKDNNSKNVKATKNSESVKTDGFYPIDETIEDDDLPF